jgi:hypothetical protein
MIIGSGYFAQRVDAVNAVKRTIGRLGGSGGHMALVIKSWIANESPDSNGEFVRVHGREAGLVSFLLSLIGVDPITTLSVDGKSVRFEQGSLAGFARRVTPLPNVSSASYGYFKPWKKASIIAAIGLAISASGVGLMFGIPLLLFAPIYYFLNKQLFLEVSDTGAGKARIEFKRSVIEGENIDERAGERIVAIVEMLLLGLAKPRRAAVASEGLPTASQAIQRAGDGFEILAGRAKEGVNLMKVQATRMGDKLAAARDMGAGSGALGGHVSGSVVQQQKCPSCGEGLATGDRFCGACGRSLA